MQTISFISIAKICVFFAVILPVFCQAQKVYFYQDFEKTTSLINPLPDSGQFSHIILTAPALSYYKFHKGYMELTRTRQDSATGGVIRVLRATPFSPNPKTLLIQITISAESIQTSAVNAIYFYAGEDFDPVNNSFPTNGLMFGRFAINFTGDSFVVKDPETQLTSKPIAVKKTVTITWALNNSSEPFTYQISKNKQSETVQPGKYDLWIDGDAVHKGTDAYPGNSAYSPSKLSNFEIRYRNGLGRIHIHDLLIKEGVSELRFEENVVMPNPVRGNSFSFSTKNVDVTSLCLVNEKGQNLPFKQAILSVGKIEILPDHPLSSGIYILGFLNSDRKKKFVRFIVE